jgi:uncharacterized repeat protein (TIGR03943 family)
MKRLCLFVVGHVGEMVLAVLLSALVLLLYTGSYKSFLHPSFWPFLLFGALIIVGGLVILATEPRLSDGQMKSVRPSVNGTVVLLPLIFLAAVIDQGMGIHAFSKKVTGTEQAALSALLALTTDKANTGKADGLLTLAEVTSGMQRLEGTRVTTEGLLYKDPTLPEGQAKLFRFQMVCCAADAIPVWILLERADMIEAANDTWLQVSGTLKRASINGNEVASIAIETADIKPTPPPSEQYLYF